MFQYFDDGTPLALAAICTIVGGWIIPSYVIATNGAYRGRYSQGIDFSYTYGIPRMCEISSVFPPYKGYPAFPSNCPKYYDFDSRAYLQNAPTK